MQIYCNGFLAMFGTSIPDMKPEMRDVKTSGSLGSRSNQLDSVDTGLLTQLSMQTSISSVILGAMPAQKPVAVPFSSSSYDATGHPIAL